MDTCPLPPGRPPLTSLLSYWPVTLILCIILFCLTALIFLYTMDPFADEIDQQKRLPNNYAALLTVEDPEGELQKALEQIVRDIPAEGIDRSKFEEGGGMIVGPAGLAYLFLHLSVSHPQLRIAGKPASYYVPLYLGPAPAEGPIDANVTGIVSNELTYCAIAAAHHRDMSWVDRFLSHMPILTASPPAGWDEFVYGRAGVLYLLRLMAHWYPACAEKVKEAYAPLIEIMLSRGPPWLFHGTDYVGTGHGRAGIVVQILMCEGEKYADRLEGEVKRLLALQMSSGQWPAKVPGSGAAGLNKDYLVQWCHGAPGLIQALTIVRPFYPALHTEIDAAIVKGRKLVWEKGLICKTPNQCHGIVGNGMVSFPPGKERMHFLAHAKEDVLAKGVKEGWWEGADYDHPYSLFTGSVGRAVGFMWHAKENGVFMGFDDV